MCGGSFLCNVVSGIAGKILLIIEMVKCDRNDVGSLILNHATSSVATDSSGGGTFRLWTSFSGGATFRGKIFAAMRCGGGPLPRRRHHHRCSSRSTVTVEDDNDAVIRTATANTKTVAATAAVRSGRSKSIRGSSRSEKLSDLLNMSESPDGRSKEMDEVRKRKMEALEELKEVVKMFQCQEMGEQKKKEGAMRVRRLAKESTEARTTLAMLGAIPPLVGMLDSEDHEILIESLYALLNLGIANDACVVLPLICFHLSIRFALSCFDLFHICLPLI